MTTEPTDSAVAFSIDSADDSHVGLLRTYVSTLRQSISDNWQQFWFTPADPATLGLIRLLAGAMLVYTHWVWGLDFASFFGPESWVPLELVQRYQRYDIVFSLWNVVPQQYAYTVHLVCVGILSLFAVGLFTRVTSLLALFIVISYANRVPTALFGLDQINGMLTFYLALGPSGAAYSLDSWLRRWNRAGDDNSVFVGEAAEGEAFAAPGLGFDASGPSVHGNIAIRLIQIHMCVIYLAAGLAKLQGIPWWNGMAMWFAFANREYQTLDMLWLAQFPILINLLTHFTVFWEVTYCVFIWIPILRPVVLFFGALMHIGIGLCMGMWTFGIIMLIGNLAFVPPQLVRRLLTRRHHVKRFPLESH